MAENKKSFVLYADLINNIDHLSNEEKGILFNHLLEYVNDMNPVLTDRVVLSAWKFIQSQLKRDLVKFEEVKEVRSKAGKESARVRALNKDKESLTNPTRVESVQQDSTNPTVNVNENVNVNDNVINSTKLLSVFNSILGKKTRVVPDKANKQLKAALKAGYSKDDIVTAITNASKDPHHVDSNYKYLTLEFITRPDKLDRFINMSDFTIKSKMI
tara:strand:- start:880 stop:1524 length:645 start_codon:yes stop_codon:yes gene_type:complete